MYFLCCFAVFSAFNEECQVRFYNINSTLGVSLHCAWINVPFFFCFLVHQISGFHFHTDSFFLTLSSWMLGS